MNLTLRDKLHARLSEEGRISFAEFMETALYDPDGGYYMTRERAVGLDGDYYTSGDVDPIFGRLLARQVREMSDRLGGGPFTLVEVGPGKGILCRDLVTACLEEAPDFIRRLSIVLIEKSPKMIAVQEEVLKPLRDRGARIAWEADVRALNPPISGCILSNELLDAFPVHRVRMTSSGLKEIFVRSNGDGFAEELGSPSTEALQNTLRRLKITLPEGYVTEVHLKALEWIKSAAAALGRGFFMTIDYGYTAEEYYHPARKTGTLLCYAGHKLSENPYDRIGVQDITAHVNFTVVALAGRDAGLDLAGFTDQMNFLIGLGIAREMEKIAAEPGFEPENKRFLAMKQLMSPAGLGKTFKVLVARKGIAPCALAGLRYRPFVPLTLPE